MYSMRIAILTPFSPTGNLSLSRTVVNCNQSHECLVKRALLRANRNFKHPFSVSGRIRMDLWVVNHASRRSRMRDVSGPSAIRRPRIRGRFGLSGWVRLSAQGVEPGGRGWCAGIRPVRINRRPWPLLRAVLGRTSREGDLGNHGRMLDGGDDLQGTTALATVLDVDLEHSFEQPGPLMGAGAASGSTSAWSGETA